MTIQEITSQLGKIEVEPKSLSGITGKRKIAEKKLLQGLLAHKLSQEKSLCVITHENEKFPVIIEGKIFVFLETQVDEAITSAESLEKEYFVKNYSLSFITVSPESLVEIIVQYGIEYLQIGNPGVSFLAKSFIEKFPNLLGVIQDVLSESAPLTRLIANIAQNEKVKKPTKFEPKSLLEVSNSHNPVCAFVLCDKDGNFFDAKFHSNEDSLVLYLYSDIKLFLADYGAMPFENITPMPLTEIANRILQIKNEVGTTDTSVYLHFNPSSESVVLEI